MQRLKFVLAGLLFSSPAFAQGDGEDPADPVVEGGGEIEMGGEGTEGTVAATGSVVWSRVLIDRPYVVPTGKIGAYGAYGVVKAVSPNAMPGMPATSLTLDVLGVGAGYGITDTITAGAQYGFGTGIVGDGEFGIGEGALGVFGNLQLVHDAKMSITASADFNFDLCGGRDMMGDCDSTMEINAGLGARYNLGPQMALFTGEPVGPGPVGQHLSISLESDGPITFALPIGFMYQATPELNVQASTTLAVFQISGAGDSRFFGADILPLTLGGLFSVNSNIDVVGAFGMPDIAEGLDLFVFSIGARYYTN